MPPKAKRRVSREPSVGREQQGSSPDGAPATKRAATGSTGSIPLKGLDTNSSSSKLSPDAAAQSQFASRVVEVAETLPPDVWLIASDGSRNPAHRLVLGARSPYFQKMFSCGMREQSSGEVNFPDIEADRLAAIIAWMYGRAAAVDVSSATIVLSLLELAKRWDVAELCDQLSSCEACTLVEGNVLEIWESAQRLCLTKLESRCQEFVMAQMADVLKGKSPTTGGYEFPPCLYSLTPAQIQVLLQSDDLPVSSEEEALELVLAYVKEHEVTLTFQEIDDLLLQIRWRLVPGAVIADRAMRHSALRMPTGESLRPKLLAAVADGMQFQFLGGQAWNKLERMPANVLRSLHRIPIRGYSGLAPGMAVRVISDVEHLRSLCKRCAPGARLKVEWVSEMRSLAGATCHVKELREEICGAQLSDPQAGVDRYLPFDALLLA